MPKKYPEPWFHARDQVWKVTIGGKQIRLHADESEARRQYHILMSEAKDAPTPATMTMLELSTLFLEWSEQNRSRLTFAEHHRYLKSFLKSLAPARTVSSLIKHDLTRWLDRQTKLGNAGRRNAITVVKRCLNWGVDEGLITGNHLARVTKPKKRRREVFLTTAQFENVLTLCTDDAFRFLLIVALETGARPEELRTLEARHTKGNRVVFPVDEHKTGESTDEPRTIYLTAKAGAIVKQLCERYPSGPLFRNRDGSRWTRHSIKDRFRRIRRRNDALEQPLDIPKGLCMYAIRHTFATEALVNGVHPEELRILMGHSDLDMIVKHYSHLAEKKPHLEQAAERARSNRTA